MKKVFGPYSPVRQAGSFYFISGQIGVDLATKQAPEGLDEQVKQLFVNLEEALAEENLTLNNIVKTTIFLKSMDDFGAVNDIYVTYFDEPRPARSCVEVSSLPKVAQNGVPLLIEIEAVAVMGSV